MSAPADLFKALSVVAHVVTVEVQQHYSVLTVRVLLDSMDWDARTAVVEIVEDYARTYRSVPPLAEIRFEFPEPTDFTQHWISTFQSPGKSNAEADPA